MKVEKIDLERLRTNSANPRKISDGNFGKLIDSVLALPKMLELRPIVVDETLTALGGNMRLRALVAISQMDEEDLKKRILAIRDVKKKKKEEKEGLVSYWMAWKDKPTALIVRAEELTDAEKQEFIIKDNASFGEWDVDALLAGWDEEDLTNWSIDIDEALRKATEGLDSPTTKEAEEDNFDEGKEQIPEVCKVGDLWQLGEHRLLCGDATKREDVERLMDGERADLVFTDPPYGNGKSGKYGRGQLGVRTIIGDENLQTFQTSIKVLDFRSIVYFIQWRTMRESLDAIEEKGLKINTIAVWDKMNAGLNGGGGISEQWEGIVFAGDIKYRKFGGNVFTISREQHKRKDSPHPHQKPIRLIAQIFDFIDDVQIILDQFGGSGSTLIACEQLGRKCRMMEITPHYCDVIIQRWEKFTGKKAVLISN